MSIEHHFGYHHNIHIKCRFCDYYRRLITFTFVEGRFRALSKNLQNFQIVCVHNLHCFSRWYVPFLGSRPWKIGFEMMYALHHWNFWDLKDTHAAHTRGGCPLCCRIWGISGISITRSSLLNRSSTSNAAECYLNETLHTKI